MEGPTPPGKSRRFVLLFVLSGIVAVAGVCVGLLFWLAPPPAPAVLPLVITVDREGLMIPGIEEDRLALSVAGVLGRPLDDWNANPSRDQIRLRFKALVQAPRSQPLVAYLASAADVDAAGAVFLLPADRVGDHPRNRLTLSELLVSFRDCPARHRLLILNLIPPSTDPLNSSRPGLLSEAVFQALEETADPGRLCLVNAGPGQLPLAAPELQRTVFGWYLEAGLSGQADGWAGEAPDGRVSVHELAAFVRERTNHYALATRGQAQTPVLVGSALDFTLQSAGRAQPEAEKPLAEAPFPDWLKSAWEEHELWQRDGRAAASPWAFRKLRTALLHAEHDLRAGKSDALVKSELDRQMQGASQLAVALSSTLAPDPLPTLAAVFPGYVSPEPVMTTDLREAARRFDSRPPTPLAPSDKPIAEPLIAPEYDAFKARPHNTLALAAFLVLAEDPGPSAARVRSLARLLASQTTTPRFAETALIQRLAALAEQSPALPWSAERAALALQTARLLEASTQPALFAWAKPAIVKAYQKRADAEAVLFAPGYASPEEATLRLRDAATMARSLNDASQRLRQAETAWNEATAWLADAGAAVLGEVIPMPVAEQLAEATRLLGNSLAPPEAGLDLASITTRAIEWNERTSAVRKAVAEFARPFLGEAVAKLRRRAESPDAGPAVIRELDQLLATPLLAAGDRASLWNARAAASRRLATAALGQVANGQSSRPVENSSQVALGSPADQEAIDKRLRWSLAILSAGSLDQTYLEKLKQDVERLKGNRFASTDRLRRAWVEEAPAELSTLGQSRAIRLAGILPVMPAAAMLDSAATNPQAIALRRAANELWGWQAARFDYESRESAGDDAAYSFAVAAARACRAVAAVQPETYLEVAAAASPKLTPERPAADLKVNFRAVGALEAPRVRVSSLSPSGDWLKVGPSKSLTLDPLRQASTDFNLAAGDNPVSVPSARGVLVEAEVGGWTYHRRVPVQLDDITERLNLIVRTAPGQPPSAANRVRVRPNGTPQPYQFVLANPTPRERKVVARLQGLNRETDVLTIGAGKSITLAFPSPQAPPVPPGTVATPGQPAPVDEGALIRGEELVVQLFDPADRETAKQTIRVPVAVANPADYLTVTDPVFKPSAGSRSNRLSATITQGDVPPGGPCVVRLGLPPERNGAILVRDGNLVGPVTRGGAPITLYTDNLALPDLAGTDVWVTVSADGVERFATYFASLPSLGETIRLTPVGQPLVRVKAEHFATGTKPLPATLEVDNAPPGATLEFAIGAASDDNSPVVPDLTLPIPTAKDVSTRVKFDPKGDTLLVSGAIKDHAPQLPVELLVGKRVLEAKLLDRTGSLLARHRTTVIFDGTPPQNVHFTDLPPRVGKDKPLTVRATCDRPISDVKEVKFFIGQPVKNAPPASPPPIAGKLFDEATNEWRAALPLDQQKGIITVGVQFTSNAGWSTIETQEVEVVDAAELNKPEPGAIAGKVIEGRLAQPDLVVFLYDGKGNARAKTTTRADGSFEFKEVQPGPYYLFCEKESTNRHIKQEVAVRPGETLAATLELLLK
jgi:hypothetical protein